MPLRCIDGALIAKIRGKYPELNELNLSNNEIPRIENLTPLAQHLRVLDLSRNCISLLEGLQDLIHLESLDLSYNYLSFFVGVATCVELRKLNIRGNQFRDVDALCSALQRDTHKLTSLDVRENSWMVPPHNKEALANPDEWAKWKILAALPQLQELNGQEVTEAERKYSLHLQREAADAIEHQNRQSEEQKSSTSITTPNAAEEDLILKDFSVAAAASDEIEDQQQEQPGPPELPVTEETANDVDVNEKAEGRSTRDWGVTTTGPADAQPLAASQEEKHETVKQSTRRRNSSGGSNNNNNSRRNSTHSLSSQPPATPSPRVSPFGSPSSSSSSRFSSPGRRENVPDDDDHDGSYSNVPSDSATGMAVPARFLLESKLERAEMELRACKQVIELQELQISDSSARDRDPRSADVLRAWRQKVFELLVQRESMEMLHAKQQLALAEENERLRARVELDDEKQFLAEQASARMLEEFNELQRQLFRSEQQLVAYEALHENAQQQLEVEQSGVQQAWQGVRGLEQLAQAMFDKFDVVGSRVAAMQQRVDFCTSRVASLLDPTLGSSSSSAFFLARRDASYAVAVLENDSDATKALKQEVNRLSAERQSVLRYWQNQNSIRDTELMMLSDEKQQAEKQLKECKKKLDVAWQQFKLGEQSNALLLQQIQLARREALQEGAASAAILQQDVNALSSRCATLDQECDDLAQHNRQLASDLAKATEELRALRHIRRSDKPSFLKHALSPLEPEQDDQVPERDDTLSATAPPSVNARPTKRKGRVLLVEEVPQPQQKPVAVEQGTQNQQEEPQPQEKKPTSASPERNGQPFSSASSTVVPKQPSPPFNPFEKLPASSSASADPSTTDSVLQPLGSAVSAVPEHALLTPIQSPSRKQKKTHLSLRINRLKDLSAMLMDVE